MKGDNLRFYGYDALNDENIFSYNFHYLMRVLIIKRLDHGRSQDFFRRGGGRDLSKIVKKFLKKIANNALF